MMISLVNRRLEYLYLLPGDEGTVKTTDQLFCFSGKHAATNHLDPACPHIFSLSA
jgi:hypothetical protein